MFEILGNDERLKKQVKIGTWDYVRFFWGDERHAPPDHPESNYKLAYDTMLSKLGIRETNIHRIKGEKVRAATIAGSIDSTQIGKTDLVARFRSRQSVAR